MGILRRSTLLLEAPAEALAKLAVTATVQTFRSRQVIYLPGDKALGVHLLSTGRVKVSKVTRDGKELTLAYRTGGDFFGEACLLEAGPRAEMVEAMETTTTVAVEREALDRVVATHAPIARQLARLLMARQRDLETKLEQLVFKDVGSKLADLLLKLGTEHGVQKRRGLVVDLRITHQEMANLIGATRETVSLTLSQFKRKGFIDTDGRKVILANRDSLRALA